ncbi:hypothetical protein KI440_03310 [Candidatus Saccharibacteria bacterium TM7i]|nr:hypothetical protein KI440_03310 [Candidatus Saccharibacteria bacterium TM7i]
MSLLQYLELQPVDIDSDGFITDSALNEYREDDTIDLSSDDGETNLIDSWLHFDDDMHE